MQTPDTVSIRFDNGYFASIESDLEFSGNLPICSIRRCRTGGKHGGHMLDMDRGIKQIDRRRNRRGGRKLE
jgi:hypothetical protein